LEGNSLVRPILAVLVVAGLLASVFCGCQPQTTGEIAVKVIVTQNFGNKLMLDELVVVSIGTSALGALEEVAMVETKYGGGFIEAINGISSQYSAGAKTKNDWFFFVNGMSANVGAREYKLHDGDVEHLDLHDWSFHAFIPATIGDFPQPFLGGYKGKTLPTIIVYDENFQAHSLDLMSKLRKLGVENVRAQAATELPSQDKGHANLILLGTENFVFISELNGNSKLGFYIYIEDGKAVVYDSRGNKTQYESDCGIIQATQNPWNPKGVGVCENVVWMISGTNKSQVRNAINALATHHEEFRYAYAAVVTGDEVIKVPG